jgi:hypothetical protein
MKHNLSKQLYNGLTKSQHNKNNEWFEMMYRLTDEGGYLLLTNIGVILRKSINGWIEFKKEGVK